ncbi:cobalt-precorrin-5B (C(1))-methyltransferase [Paludifilum halophilum]|uniref:Cobalt-precorrin-5B C(1)-methyltransferase n=1 Tax=Paludifilum halophilum TaxID=1642702 RepID=A0A235BA53_9BACL|nr:cobalt-precorrin-5B (C(1))-methyltransferase [Paludifilum halophilum]OYD09151.1 cobalt-precorrin-5B (C(1))-methyltransferase [Paludifilum halophilum]
MKRESKKNPDSPKRVTQWEEVTVNGKKRRLRTGFTTGACAAAAVKGALLALQSQRSLSCVDIQLPIGDRVSFDLVDLAFDPNGARCGVVKDGGDDPDATHGAVIKATVSWRKEPGFLLDGGEGVGRVTKPGLSVPVGEAAINPVPRRMIRQSVEEVAGSSLKEQGVKAILSVPGGEEIARKTLNGRLGIIGGISILGTTGVVRPYSTAAYRASVIQAVRVAAANGCGELVLTTGGRSEKAAMRLYPHLPQEAFIEMADFLGDALKTCSRHSSIRRIHLVGMMGKLSKAAAGHLELHSGSASVDLPFLARVARETGASEADVRQILSAATANRVGQLMRQRGNRLFFDALCRTLVDRIRATAGKPEGEVILISLQGEVLGRQTAGK